MLMSMNTPPQTFYWFPDVISKLMQDNGIATRNGLVKELRLSKPTVYRHFSDEWEGTATFPLLTALSEHFGVDFNVLAGPRKSTRKEYAS